MYTTMCWALRRLGAAVSFASYRHNYLNYLLPKIPLRMNSLAYMMDFLRILSHFGLFQVRLHMGFYFIFLQEWFQVFPREQFLIIRTEDYSSNMIYYLQKTYRFLGLRK